MSITNPTLGGGGGGDVRGRVVEAGLGSVEELVWFLTVIC